MKEEIATEIAKSLGISKFKDDETLSWEERFKKLEQHHQGETQKLYERIWDLENHPSMDSEYWPDEMFEQEHSVCSIDCNHHFNEETHCECGDPSCTIFK